jgi:hypothetical protein
MHRRIAAIVCVAIRTLKDMSARRTWRALHVLEELLAE